MFLAFRAIAGGLLKAIPAWAFAIAACLAWGSWQHHRATAAGARALAVQRELDGTRATAAQAKVDAMARQLETQKETVHVAQLEAARNSADAAAAGDALRRLRQRAATAGRSGAASTPATGSEAAGTPGPVCADLLIRAGEAAGQLAAYADRARTAGEACERINGRPAN